MAAYLIVLCRIHDRPAFLERYAKPAAALVAEMGGAYVVRAPGLAVLEGDGAMDGASAVISMWPSRAAALAFWESPAYAKLKAARASLCDAQVMIVEEPT